MYRFVVQTFRPMGRLRQYTRNAGVSTSSGSNSECVQA